MTLPKTPRPASYDYSVWDTPLRCIRRERGWSIARVAAETGMNASTYWKTEHGADPSLSNAMAIAKFFGVSIETLWNRRKGKS